MKTDYEAQAQAFLDKTGAKLTVTFQRQGKYFADDKDERDIYDVTLARGNRYYNFMFGQSLVHSGRFHKYGNPSRGISQGVKTGIDGVYNKPYPYDEWDKNKDFAKPTAYDILASVQKYNPGTFENFCSDFGYDTDSRKAEKIYRAVMDEYQNLAMLFSDTELEEMAEIN